MLYEVITDSLVARSIEYTDNVIPASNSIMAKNLFKLSHYFNNEHFSKTVITSYSIHYTKLYDVLVANGKDLLPDVKKELGI